MDLDDDDSDGAEAVGSGAGASSPATPGEAIETVLPDGTVLRGFTRVIVFSFFTQFLDIVGGALGRREGWSPACLTRLDGSMSAAARQAALATFKGTTTGSSASSGASLPCWVLLLSGSSGSLGLNITEANVAYLCDPFWSPSIEAQAVARMWRLGQSKHVWIRRLVVSGSIEERILLIQRRKAVLSDALVEEGDAGGGGGEGGGGGGLTADDLQLLFTGGGGLGLRDMAPANTEDDELVCIE